jgi:diguanylate cyclase (GGDEF)-like protein/PAS domain S-box-containing protein
LRQFLKISFWIVTFLLVLPHVGSAVAQQSVSSQSATLTETERAWLAGNHTVRARVSDYPPYMLTKPSPSGISVDYLLFAAKRYGFRVEFVTDTIGFPASVRDVSGPREHYDLLLTFTRTPEREKQFAITNDYLSAPWVIYARQDSPYIIGLESLDQKTVAVEKGYLIGGKIRSDYPNIRLLEVAKSEDALLAVATGQADAYVGNLANASYLIKAHRLDNLVVTAPSPYGINTQAMAIRNDWPELASLINKGIAAMTADERYAITQKWGASEFRSKIDYTLIWQIVAVSSLILLAFLYWNRKLAREVDLRRMAETSLRETAAKLSVERDRLELRVAERTAHLSEALEFNETMLLNSPVPMGIYAENGQCVMANEAYAKFVGATREELLTQNFNEIASWQRTSLYGDCLAALKFKTPRQQQAYTTTSFGKEVWFEYRILPRHLKGQDHLLIQFFDLTEHKRQEEKLRQMAFHDSLTGLSNRRLLLDRLKQALRLGKREGSYLAVLFIDLDKFKQLNDTCGHDVGDQMLTEVASRLGKLVRDSDTVARLGGDEFIVLLSGLGTDPELAAKHAESVVVKIRNTLSSEYLFGDIRYQGSASVGVKILLGSESDPDQILKEADVAMYEIKRSREARG